MKEAEELLLDLMQEALTTVAANKISAVMRAYRSLTPANRDSAIKDMGVRGQQEYKSLLLEAMATLSLDAIAMAAGEVPSSKFKFADIDDVPPALQKKLKARADSLVGKQVSDLEAELKFAYLMNQELMGNEELEYFLTESAGAWVDGTSLRAGASITSSTVISDARESFFFEDDVKEEIVAFEFVNGDPVTPICQDLAGTVFDKDDPDLFRYTPPLHWNCKSWIRPILSTEELSKALKKSGQEDVTKLRPSSKKIEDTIQFAGCDHHKHLDEPPKQ